MKIHLPNSGFLGNIDPFLKSMNLSNPKELIITANKKWISIHPVILCMVASLGIELNKKNIVCEKLEAKSKHYLQRMGLFKILKIDNKINITEHESSGRFIPLTIIKNSNDLSKFITEIIPLLHLEKTHSESINYVISELVRNVIEHSKYKKGAIVCAQYYKKSNTIRIGIVDRGIGLKKAINQSHYSKDYIEAIRLALTPGITGTTSNLGGSELNAGAGLFFIKSIIKMNKEFFMIYSGNSMYKLLKSKNSIKLNAEPFNDRHSKNNNYPYWQGTVIGIDISLDKTKEFSYLLDSIRDIFITSIKERKKQIYKKPRFI
ncbi:MAG: hypothetical protein ACMXX8_01050 [Candidatus Woesearchaeota archaeon]